MSNFFDKEDAMRIKMLNENLGMEHRHKPMDLNNAEDLCEYLKFKSCAFLDYLNYSDELSDLLERYDESIEYYDTATWINLSVDANKADKLLLESYALLSQAENVFYKISDRAEKECAEALIFVLKSKKSLQRSILGFEYELNDEMINKIIKSVFEEPERIDYYYNMESSFESFIRHVNKTIALTLFLRQ